MKGVREKGQFRIRLRYGEKTKQRQSKTRQEKKTKQDKAMQDMPRQIGHDKTIQLKTK